MLTYILEIDLDSHVTKFYSNLSIFLDANLFHIDQNLTKNNFQPNEVRVEKYRFTLLCS